MERNYYRELTTQLEKSGIIDASRNVCLPEEFVGLKFRFQAKWGSHFEVMIGQILGVAYSDEGGVQIEVSPKRFGGLPLISLMYAEEGWCAYLDFPPMPELGEEQDLKCRFRVGTLELY